MTLIESIPGKGSQYPEKLPIVRLTTDMRRRLNALRLRTNKKEADIVRTAIERFLNEVEQEMGI